jgi:hypothetical protein
MVRARMRAAPNLASLVFKIKNARDHPRRPSAAWGALKMDALA